MKQINIVNAYQNIEKLSEIKDLNEQERWALYQLRRRLRAHFEYQKKREDEIRSKYTEFANEEGQLAGEKAQEFLNEINELNNMDIDLGGYAKVNIRLVNDVSFVLAESLEDFIEFTPC